MHYVDKDQEWRDRIDAIQVEWHRRWVDREYVWRDRLESLMVRCHLFCGAFGTVSWIVGYIIGRFL